VEIYTIGFTQTTAERFFKRLVDAGLERLLETSFGSDWLELGDRRQKILLPHMAPAIVIAGEYVRAHDHP
jgi:hypothetical protein